MIDIHTHILFEIDDGAKNITESMMLLDKQIKQGVTKVVLTPHFNPLNQEIGIFVNERNKKIELLRQEIFEQGKNISIIKGAEVYYSSKLIEMDLSELTIEGTDYILIEFPTTTIPSNLKGQLSEIQGKGYIPIIAHFERYEFLKYDLQLPVDLIKQGILMQVNSESILNKSSSNFIKASIKHNWIHLIASDAHNLDNRVPNLASAINKYKKWNRKGEGLDIILNAKKVINNEIVCFKEPTNMRRVLGHFF